eukprot:4841289-Pleurochrysis_carterae.AAC.1
MVMAAAVAVVAATVTVEAVSWLWHQRPWAMVVEEAAMVAMAAMMAMVAAMRSGWDASSRAHCGFEA